jgi:hypothetical protein
MWVHAVHHGSFFKNTTFHTSPINSVKMDIVVIFLKISLLDK